MYVLCSVVMGWGWGRVLVVLVILGCWLFRCYFFCVVDGVGCVCVWF